MRISDWSSDVCSSDLVRIARGDRRKRVRSRIDALIGAEHDAGAAVADFDPTIDDHDARAITIPTHREARAAHAHLAVAELGRAARRDRVREYVLITVVAVMLKAKRLNTTSTRNTTTE